MSSEIGTCGDCSPSCQGREVRQVCGHDSVCSCLFSPTLLAFHILAPSLSRVESFRGFLMSGGGTWNLGSYDVLEIGGGDDAYEDVID